MASIDRRQLLVVLLSLAVGVGLAGCERESEDTTLTDGLLVLSGDVGSVRLTVREDDGARSRAVELPDAGTSWVSAGRTNVLLAVLVDGRTYVSDPLGEDDPTWRLVEPVTVTDLPPEPPLFYGTWDPPGGAYAQLGADFSEGGGMRAVVVDPGLDQAVEVPMNQSRPVAAPPAWIDDDRLVLISATSEGTEAVIVDSASQGYDPGPSGVQLVATSADAATAAVWRGPGRPVEIQSTTSWLADEPAGVEIDPPDGAAMPLVLALDADGDRLAVVWSDEEGTPTGITVHAAPQEWARVATFDLGEANAATVAWLR
jgi:hypothetical protein